MERGTGVAGRCAALPVEMETRSERGHAVTPAQQPSRELVTCRTAQVKTRLCTAEQKDIDFGHIDFAVFHLLIQLSPHVRLSKGIEDAFKTAATEVSLLAGTDEFNATELFGVGEILLVLLQSVPHSDALTLLKTFQPPGSSIRLHIYHSSRSGCAP